MREILVECYPDAHLVQKIGFTKKYIRHCFGKANVLNQASKKENILALVDEDPESAKHPHQQKMKVVDKFDGINHYKDNSNNNIFELKIKLEDWIISVCKISKIKLSDFGLSDEPDRLHKEINQKLDNFDKLLDFLIEKQNPVLLKLREWLTNEK